MSKLPDGTNPYGRLLDIMHKTSPKAKGLKYGVYLGDKKFLIGDQTIEPGDYLLIQHEIEIDNYTFKIPGLDEQEHTVERHITHNINTDYERVEHFSFDVKVPTIQKDDTVIAYQFGDEEYIVLGKAVDVDV